MSDSFMTNKIELYFGPIPFLDPTEPVTYYCRTSYVGILGKHKRWELN